MTIDNALELAEETKRIIFEIVGNPDCKLEDLITFQGSHILVEKPRS
jgi:hypothetical protein